MSPRWRTRDIEGILRYQTYDVLDGARIGASKLDQAAAWLRKMLAKKRSPTAAAARQVEDAFALRLPKVGLITD